MPASGSTLKCKLICLAGFMGSGKTTVGQRLARQLGWRFVDLDTAIEERAGLRIADIFERLGEPAFREIERELLAEAVGRVAELDQPAVLALGGGTFVQPANLELLRSVRAFPPAAEAGSKERAGVGTGFSAVIWLDCPVDDLLGRCATMGNRPLFRDEAAFRKLYEERLPFYRMADFRVVSNADPHRVVEQILALGLVEPAAGALNSSEQVKL